ncbi:MAG: glycosyltransferase family 4 protein [Chloroflexi bacterium]|nr:glycosyltransferase family 4 protein [Chloroflexota bacterium]
MDASPRIVMVANARIPSERAHPLQIMHMAAGFAAGGATVLLAYARRANTEAMRSVRDPFKYAGVPRAFALVGLPTVDAIKRVTIDWPVLNHGPIRLVAHLLQLWSFALAALTVVRRWKPHVVYSRDLLPLTVLRLLLGQPARFCFEVHTVPRSRLSAALHLWAARRMDAVIAITEGLQRWYINAGFDRERLLVAPDAVDLRAFASRDRGDARSKLGIPGDAPLVCYLGHLYPWKGVDTLVEAARQAEPDVQWVIVGGISPDLDRIRATAADLPNVHVTGHLPPEEARQYLVAADVAVIPFSARQIISREHTSPLKLFEYMAAERPIVASDLPSLREVLHHERNALLVAPDEPNALAEDVTRLLNDKALANRLATAARLEVESRTWTRRAAAISEFLESSPSP